jgi:hypothetical protein
LREQFNDPNVQRVLEETLRAAAARRGRLGGAAEALTSELLNVAPRTPLEARSVAAQIDLALGLNIFEYLGRYFSYRYANFYEVVEQYACHATPEIDTFVTLMVDFDEPLSGRPNPKSPLNQQIALISKICQLSQGRLVALAPFCPFKDIARAGGESFANIQQAWKLPGFVGAKIYPPMGFQAYGNARTTLPQGAAVDAALARLYRECIKEDAAVLAHAGPSLCVAQGPCDSPGPPGWAAALDFAYTTTGKPLRVSLGHFGDPFGDQSESHDWPKQFLMQMEAPSGARLFADLAYASEILDPTKEQAAVDMLHGLLSSHPIVYERLLYGSDWLMLGLESTWKDYLTRMHTVIEQVESDSGKVGFANRFFGANARAWLGLDVPTSLASRNGF